MSSYEFIMIENCVEKSLDHCPLSKPQSIFELLRVATRYLKRGLVLCVAFAAPAMVKIHADFAVETTPTKPIEGQKPGTSGIRKKTKVFMEGT